MRGIFLDIETNGLDPMQHRAIDIAFKIVDITHNELKATYQSMITQPEDVWAKHDPNSLVVNGYTWEEIAKGKTESQVANEIKTLFSDLKIERGRDVFICQNPSFDRAYFNQLIPVYDQEKFNWPYHWLDLASMYWAVMLKDSKSIPERMTVSKNEIGKRYHIPPEERPHHAMNGVNHLMRCYSAVLGYDFQVV